ncbi:transforming growth factor-beta-induced protein ig-h3-like [Ruditapes philippinarum]|uniref:transforming growth factor-beta-induced protein ig-h3-like n=1 Tax=Ruditapes philippinarum TaxID=129788 RepID=UPI00295ACCBC|nr:transforming growth factor-beta-induced protein ig-h3-like [Ruditapes philippinarum]
MERFSFIFLLSLVTVCTGLNLYEQLTALNATTLLSLVDKAGLSSVLKTGGSFTLLVPTNHAFSKLPDADLAAVTNNQQKLTDVIKYHMINGVHYQKEFLFGRHHFYNSTNGHVIRVYRSASGTHFNQATAVKSNITASNGVIYLINTVLDVPEGTVIDILGNKAYNISKFLALVHKAKLDVNYAMPTGINRYTVFAPSDAAIDAVPAATIQSLSQDITNLRMLIEYHVHSGTMHARTLAKHHFVRTTLPAHNISVTTSSSGDITLNNMAHVTLTDIEAENGVVHIIDHVLMPMILNPIIG